jgi:hypothetical protein
MRSKTQTRMVKSSDAPCHFGAIDILSQTTPAPLIEASNKGILFIPPCFESRCYGRRGRMGASVRSLSTTNRDAALGGRMFISLKHSLHI